MKNIAMAAASLVVLYFIFSLDASTATKNLIVSLLILTLALALLTFLNLRSPIGRSALALYIAPSVLFVLAAWINLALGLNWPTFALWLGYLVGTTVFYRLASRFV